jgi:nickel/cobalt transporter (NicO) family protein
MGPLTELLQSGRVDPVLSCDHMLVLCLQVNQIWLGGAVVLCFSVGLVITLTAAGIIAAAEIGHFSRRWPGFGEFALRVPYLSGIVMIALGLYVSWQGLISVPTAL